MALQIGFKLVACGAGVSTPLARLGAKPLPGPLALPLAVARRPRTSGRIGRGLPDERATFASASAESSRRLLSGRGQVRDNELSSVFCVSASRSGVVSNAHLLNQQSAGARAPGNSGPFLLSESESRWAQNNKAD